MIWILCIALLFLYCLQLFFHIFQIHSSRLSHLPFYHLPLFFCPFLILLLFPLLLPFLLSPPPLLPFISSPFIFQFRVAMAVYASFLVHLVFWNVFRISSPVYFSYPNFLLHYFFFVNIFSFILFFFFCLQAVIRVFGSFLIFF